jgi:hypothetical protein
MQWILFPLFPLYFNWKRLPPCLSWISYTQNRSMITEMLYTGPAEVTQFFSWICNLYQIFYYRSRILQKIHKHIIIWHNTTTLLQHFRCNVQNAVHLVRDIHVPYQPHSSKSYDIILHCQWICPELSFNSSTFRGLFLYTRSLRTFHKKKSGGVRSGVRADHSSGPRRRIHRHSKCMSNHFLTHKA